MTGASVRHCWLFAREYYNSRYRRFASRAHLLDWQQLQLDAHLKWVCRNSPYYRDFAQLPLSEFPVMNKSLMMDNFNHINTLGLDRDQLFDIALRAEETRGFDQSALGNITVGMSSGTSGRRGLFVVSKEEQARWAGYIVGRLMPSVLRPQRIALLLRANSNLYESVGRAHMRFQYTDLCQPVSVWLEKLEQFRPTIMVGSAQALLVAARESRNLNPRLVVSGAEVLTVDEKYELEHRFNCEVKEVYQCTEGFLASTHRDGRMRWNEDLVHIEKQWINKEKTHFQPVVTDFRRKSQPVIRYLMDDVIVPFEDNGVFGGIDKIAGRCGDILCIHGTKVLPDLVYNAVSRAVGTAVHYQVAQISGTHLKISASHSGELIENALRRLFATVGVNSDLPLTCELAAEPEQELSAKHRRVVNYCLPDDSLVVNSAA
jgi:putative adenylate-forming enzyme